MVWHAKQFAETVQASGDSGIFLMPGKNPGIKILKPAFDLKRHNL